MQILTTIALIVIGVLLFEFIIFAHEFGHFITAKRSGVQVNEFALGMGPKIFGFKKGETQYSLRLFPIGGYCAMEGEDERSDNPRAFGNAKIWKRMIIIVAGAFMNFVVGFLLVLIVTISTPQFASTTVREFVPNSATATSGLMAGDKIVNVGGYAVWNIKDLQFGIQTLEHKNVDPASIQIYREDCTQELVLLYSDIINDNDLSDELMEDVYTNSLQKYCSLIDSAGSKEKAYELMKQGIDDIYIKSGVSKPKDYKYPEIKTRDERIRYTGDVTVIRDGKKTTLKDVNFFTYYKDDQAKKDKKYSVSMDFYVDELEKNFGTVMSETVTGTATLARSVWKSLVMLVQGRFSFADLSGPVGITKAVSTVASEGLKSSFGDAVFNIVYIMALITINLGVVNLLPFPALDGGRFVFLVIEAIIRRPLPQKVEYIVNGAGLVILLGFIAVVSVKDIFQLVTGTFPTV